MTNEHPPGIYTQDYRHFDTLVWQVPTWTSAIFALTATAAGFIVANANSITAASGLSARYLLGTFLSVMTFVLFLLSNVLFRFRLHHAQIVLSPEPNLPASRFLPRGHTSLQLIAGLECGALLGATLLTFRTPWLYAIVIPALIAAFLLRHAEAVVVKERENAKQRSNVSVQPTP